MSQNAGATHGAALPLEASKDPSSNEDLDDKEDYVNPLQNQPRWTLTARAYAIRLGATIGFSLSNLMSAMAPTKTIWLHSTLAKQKGKEKIKVEVWEDLEKRSSSSEEGSATARPKRPAVINFHGGGFVLGQGTDDALWAGAVVMSLDAFVFSVNYRLAPEYPFPIPSEDCADAILQISQLEDFDIDTDRILLSGFSAGATLSLASWAILQSPQTWGYQLPSVPPKIAGFVLFYPLLDWTLSRPRKRETSSEPDNTLPKGLTDLFDASYVYPPMPRAERSDIRLSPGLMPDDLLGKLPPVHLCLCEYDMLLAEAQRFAERLKTLGKEVSVCVVEKEKHAWDKMPFSWPTSVNVEYGHAIEEMRKWSHQRV